MRIDIFLDSETPAACVVNEISMSSFAPLGVHARYFGPLWIEPYMRGLYRRLATDVPIHLLNGSEAAEIGRPPRGAAALPALEQRWWAWCGPCPAPSAVCKTDLGTPDGLALSRCTAMHRRGVVSAGSWGNPTAAERVEWDALKCPDRLPHCGGCPPDRECRACCAAAPAGGDV